MPDQRQPPPEKEQLKTDLATLMQQLRDERLFKKTPQEKPDRWKQRTVASYYKEDFAKELQPIVDGMLADGANAKPRVFKYAAFPNISHGSLYVKISQAFMYLIDHFDTPEKKYRIFRDAVSLKRKHTLGISMELKEGVADPSAPDTSLSAGVDILEDEPEKETKAERKARMDFEKRNEWKEQLETWLETAVAGGPLFHAKKLSLTPDEVTSIKEQFVTLRNFLVKATHEEVKIACIDPENPFAK